MSHIVCISVEVRDFDAIKSAACRLNLKEPVHGKAEIFQTEIEGVLVELPDWIYPVVCVLETGEVKYDTYNGNWGDEKCRAPVKTDSCSVVRTVLATRW